jgi:hypothetical protein
MNEWTINQHLERNQKRIIEKMNLNVKFHIINLVSILAA